MSSSNNIDEMIQELIQEKEDLKITLFELEDELNLRISNHEKEIKQKDSQISILEMEVLELKNQLQIQIKNVESSVFTIQEYQENLKMEMEKKEIKERNMKEQIESISNDYLLVKEENDQLNIKINELRIDYEKLIIEKKSIFENNIITSANQFISKEGKVNENKAYSKAIKDLKEIKDRETSKNIEFSLLSDEIQILKKENINLKGVVNQMKNEIKDLKSHNNNLNHNLNDTMYKYEDLNIKYNDIKTNYNRMNSSKSEFISKSAINTPLHKKNRENSNNELDSNTRNTYTNLLDFKSNQNFEDNLLSLDDISQYNQYNDCDISTKVTNLNNSTCKEMNNTIININNINFNKPSKTDQFNDSQIQIETLNKNISLLNLNNEKNLGMINMLKLEKRELEIEVSQLKIVNAEIIFENEKEILKYINIIKFLLNEILKFEYNFKKSDVNNISSFKKSIILLLNNKK